MHLNFKVIGEGFPVIILHGLFGMLDNWQSIAKKLAEEGYMIYLPDMRNHGKSPSDNEFNYSVLAEDIYQFCEENWIYKSHIIGHSMGGKIAMQFAFDHDDMVEKLVVIDICNKTYLGGHESIFNAIETINAEKVKDREEVYLHLKNHSLDEGTIQFLLKNLTRKAEGGYEWKMKFEILKESYPFILDKAGIESSVANVPTLFVKGELSNYITPKDEIHIKSQFPDSNIISIENAGHWVHADQPGRLLSVLSEFLSGQ